MVLGAPKFFYVQDTANRVFSEGDSIELRGYGFQSHERIRFFLGDSAFAIASNILTDSDGVFRIKTFLPWVPQGPYHLEAMRESGNRITSDSTLYITRTLDYEFEKLPIIEGADECGYNYLSYSYRHWSQGAQEFCNGNWKRGSAFSFEIQVPFADSFAVKVFGSNEWRFGIYRTYMNGEDIGVYDWYWPNKTDLRRDSAIFANVFLHAGIDTIRFVNEGWDDSAIEYSIGLDNLELTPLSAGTRASTPPFIATENPVVVYPDPATNDVVHISSPFDTARISIYSSIGQQVMKLWKDLRDDPSLNISALHNGNYWLTLENGSKRFMVPFSVLR